METVVAPTPESLDCYPNLTDRVQSSFIDTVFIVILMFAFAALLDRFDGVPDWVRIALFVGLWAVYEPLCTSVGGTIGNLTKGIRVRKYSDTKARVNFLQGLLRYTVKILLGWVSFLTIHSNPERRAIHDIVAGTIMIRKRALA